MSIRLHFVVEGQTEETFVNHVLGPHLAQVDVFSDARCVYTARVGAHWSRGGVSKYAKIRRDVMHWTRQDSNPDARFTTMFDLYRLPTDFPGQVGATETDAHRRAKILEAAFGADINDLRFVPYVQVHEFEALILAHPAALAKMFPDRRREIDALTMLAKGYATPELINLENPPSKRIKAVLLGYHKIGAASQVASAIGVSTLCSRCPHFGEWVKHLESLRMSAP